MATGITITNKHGQSAFFPSEILPLLKAASRDYRADATGMADGGICLTSTFVSYCNLKAMQMLMDTSGQIYKADAQTYAARYNRLFDIDGN